MRFRRGLAALMMMPLFAVAAAVTVVGAPSASAAPPTYTLQNASSGYCLADVGGDLRHVAMSACTVNLSDKDRWYKSGYGDGTYRLQNVSTKPCLDESLGLGLRTAPCQPPGQYQMYQAWDFSGVGIQNEYYLQVRSTGTCLDDSLALPFAKRPTLAKCIKPGTPSWEHEDWIEYKNI